MRIFTRIAACACLAAQAGLAAAPSFAADYPSRVVTLVDAFAPGGTSDLMARYVATQASKAWGQSVVVENRPGAGGQIGIDSVVRAAPDGYTMLALPDGNYTVGPLFMKLPYDVQRDLTPVAGIARVPIVMAVGPSVRANTVKEFIELARKNPGKLTFGSAGEGTRHQLAAQMFQMMTGTTMIHVPYKGTGPAVADLMGGHIDVIFCPIGGVLPGIKAGKLKALGVAGTGPVTSLPGVPTIAESGIPGFVTEMVFGLFGPKNLPEDVVRKWAQELEQAPAGEASASLTAQGIEMTYIPRQELVAYLNGESAKWKKVVNGMRPPPTR